MNLSKDMKEYMKKEAKLLKAVDTEFLSDLVDDIHYVANDDGTVYICGNGGSFLTAQHFAEDVSKGTFLNNKEVIRIVPLGSNPGLQMAIANDLSYEDIFDFELAINDINECDMLICLSVSGNSKNVIKAAHRAVGVNAHVIAFVGFNGDGDLAEITEHVLSVDSSHFGLVEDVHNACLHNVAYQLMEETPCPEDI